MISKLPSPNAHKIAILARLSLLLFMLVIQWLVQTDFKALVATWAPKN